MTVKSAGISLSCRTIYRIYIGLSADFKQGLLDGRTNIIIISGCMMMNFAVVKTEKTWFHISSLALTIRPLHCGLQYQTSLC